MNTKTSITLADIDEDVAAEKARHAVAMAELESLRAYILRRGSTAAKSKSISFDPNQYGGKKRLMLTLLSQEDEGLSSTEAVAAAQKAGWRECSHEKLVPQLSIWKSGGLVTQEDGQWMITEAGREYLASLETN